MSEALALNQNIHIEQSSHVVVEKTKRIVGLDFLRSALMLLGIPYHAGLVFSGYWIYTASAQQGNTVFSLFSSVSHVFRMQLFFLLAGFFTQLVMSRKGVEHFIKSRIYRVFLPFFIFYMAFNLVCAVFVGQESYWRNAFLGHFWFVYVLMAYTALTILFKNKLHYICHMKLATFSGVSLGALLLSFYMRQEDFVFASLFAYLPYFIIGFILYEKKDAVRLTSWYVIRQLVLFAALFTCQFIVARHLKHMPFAGFADQLVSFLTPIPLITLLFYFFYTIDMKPRKIIDIIVKSSFTIYLLHHPFIVMYAHFMNQFTLNSFAFYSLLVGMTAGTCYLLYFLLKKSSLMNRLLALS